MTEVSYFVTHGFLDENRPRAAKKALYIPDSTLGWLTTLREHVEQFINCSIGKGLVSPEDRLKYYIVYDVPYATWPIMWSENTPEKYLNPHDRILCPICRTSVTAWSVRHELAKEHILAKWRNY